uniref:AMP-binding domain protein n=1 Tax=uncultured bacterium 50 TaxID=1748278 RepID=A0A0U3TTX8_9BACT|nr:AMP-binding domain protein [uncultured bacterium 50]
MRAHKKGRTDIPLLEQTVGDNFEATVAKFPDREALVIPHQGIRWTYQQLNAEVDRVARGLLARGYAKGDRLGVWAPNLAEWVLAQFATAKLGVIQVNINPAYRTSELAYALQKVGCRGVIAARQFKTSNYVKMLEEVRGECPDLKETIFIDDPGQPADWARLLADGERVSQADVAARMKTLSPLDAINIQYTSGTTGSPKGATLSHRNIINNAYFDGQCLGLSENDRFCVPVPFYHCAGMVCGNLMAAVYGAAIVVPAPSFDPGETLKAIQNERCTAAMCVPTMFIAMMGHPDFEKTDKSSLRTGTIGGSPCPVEVMKRLVTDFHMPEVQIIYGMTETSPISMQTGADDPIEKRVGSVGRAHPHVEVRIANPDTGETCDYGETGEFQTRGYSVMLGYWNDEKKTQDSITPDGWMRTGDLATMDEQGYANIVGRIKDMIIRGGENVYPVEIEGFLYTHPDIRDVQVIGVPDEKFGEEVMACVIMKEGRPPLTFDAMKAFCKDKLAHYKVPRYLEVVDGYPMTVTGKVRKVEMREQAVKKLGLEKAASIRTA